MQVPILNGVWSDGGPDFRSAYPRNLVPVPKAQGISEGYLRPADGLKSLGTGPGIDRGGIEWKGALYRVMGSKLVRIAADSTVTVMGDVGAGGQVSLDYSFDRLGIASGGRLYYLQGNVLTAVTDSDIGIVLDVMWIDGYWMTTDGTSLVVTELNDPTAVNPLKYGSSESDPDPVKCVIKSHNEVYAVNRYTIEVFDNIGGANFPFQRIEGAQVSRGAIGTHAAVRFADAIAFVGGARNEAPAVWIAASGTSDKLSTREVETILQEFTEAQLSEIVVETRADKGHQQLLIHLPDRCLVYDMAASKAVGEPVWYVLTSSVVGLGAYRARNMVWCYDRWNIADPTSATFGTFDSEVSSHYGTINGWDCSTFVLYNEARNGIVHEIEAIALTGRVPLGAEPTVWTSYSSDGQNWSSERPSLAGRQGDRQRRIAWRRQGQIGGWRIQRLRGTSEAHLSLVRLEMTIEPLGEKRRGH